MANLIKKLKGIDANKAYGPFDPSIKIMKLFADCFAVPLLHIFNQSFQSIKFPEVWKISNVCAIPKTTPCNRVEELRPMSLTSVLSKVQESYAVEWMFKKKSVFPSLVPLRDLQLSWHWCIWYTIGTRTWIARGRL